MLVEVISVARTSTSKVPGVKKCVFFDIVFAYFCEASFWKDFDDFCSLLGSIFRPSGPFFRHADFHDFSWFQRAPDSLAAE